MWAVRRLLDIPQWSPSRLLRSIGLLICIASLAPWAYGEPYFGRHTMYLPGALYGQGQLTLLSGLVILWGAWRHRHKQLPQASLLILAAAFGLCVAVAVSTLLDPMFLRRLPGGGMLFEGWATHTVSPAVWIIGFSGVTGITVCVQRLHRQPAR